MLKNFRINKEHLTLVAGLAFYLLVAAALVHKFRYAINPDCVSYISIAKTYLKGHFTAAVNGYWSPLFSWLLMPLLAGGVDGLLAAKIMNIIFGAGLLISFWALLGLYAPRAVIKSPLWVAAAVIVLDWVMTGPVTPDLLVAAILLAYLYFSSRYVKSPGWQLAVLCGGIGAAAYFAKTYALAFVLVHFTFTQAVAFFNHGKRAAEAKRLAKLYAIGLLALVVLAMPWFFAISMKYHKPTTGTSAAYNLALAGPLKQNHPMLVNGLIPPPTPDAVSAWNDPSYFTLKSWSPLKNKKFVFSLMEQNAKLLASFTSALTCFWVVVVFICAVALVPRKGRSDLLLWLAAGAGAIYLAGYTATFMESRYIWFFFLVLITAAARLMWLFSKSEFYSLSRLTLMVGALSLSLIYNPLHSLFTSKDSGKPIHNLVQSIPEKESLSGRKVASYNAWDPSLYLAFETGAKYYGVLNGNNPGQQLDANGVEILLVWGPPSSVPFEYSQDRVIYQDGGISVLALK